ncbi:M15 family metallopeptidase [Streptomyces sp. NBC_01352]|uniref:M15 family metallopeptidase n=1 Tax=Streptomyces sp. NBC_01352 TaxID=2903834 RepID=UPI002E31A480|nr:M15 family metallopeptidase [Streptomyces sp. NBC_01352]
MIDREVSRRRFVGGGAGILGVVTLGSVLSAAPAVAVPKSGREWREDSTANGWRVLTEADAEEYRVEGSGLAIRLAAGDAAVLLLHVARRFHYEIDALRTGDLHGHSTSRLVNHPFESNHLSGTAINIRPHAYPLGVSGGLYPAELVVIRDILAELGGTVAWGGDFTTPKESHFEIALAPTHPKVKGVARTIRGWNGNPGKGAGATDAFAPARRSRAGAFEQRRPVLH